MSSILHSKQTSTYGDYLHWDNDKRYELIDGEPYLMSPGPDLAHQDVVGEIYFQVRQALKGKPCRAFISPIDVRLPKHNEDDKHIDTVVQPDFLVVCDSKKLDKRGVRGAPDWLVEVLSPGSVSRDQIIKRRLYEQHGVKEYWLIHPVDRLVWVYCLENNQYGKPEIYEMQGATAVKILPEIQIVWDELAARLPVDEEDLDL